MFEVKIIFQHGKKKHITQNDSVFTECAIYCNCHLGSFPVFNGAILRLET